LISSLNNIFRVRVGFLVTSGIFALITGILGFLYRRARKKGDPDQPLNDPAIEHMEL